MNVGIAGYGVVGKLRRQCVDQHPFLRTVAVCDRTFGGNGTLPDGLRYYSNYQTLLEEDLDILFVCLTNDIAAKVTMAGLDRNLHVFCEKPPGRNLDEIAEVIHCEKRHPSQKLKYGFNHRYHESVQDALKIVQSGELGRIVDMRGVYGKSRMLTFESDWRTKREIAGGGILLDQGIHMVDMMRLFAGEFTDIYSFVSNSFWKHDVEDNAYALMRTKDGVVVLLQSSATQWRHRFNLEITLSRGTLLLSGILSGSKSYGAETMTVAYAETSEGGDPREQTIRYNQDTSWRDEIAEFAEAILQDKPIINGSSSEAFKTMQLVYRIYCADFEWQDRYRLTDKVGI